MLPIEITKVGRPKKGKNKISPEQLNQEKYNFTILINFALACHLLKLLKSTLSLSEIWIKVRAELQNSKRFFTYFNLSRHWEGAYSIVFQFILFIADHQVAAVRFRLISWKKNWKKLAQMSEQTICHAAESQNFFFKFQTLYQKGFVLHISDINFRKKLLTFQCGLSSEIAHIKKFLAQTRS